MRSEKKGTEKGKRTLCSGARPVAATSTQDNSSSDSTIARVFFSRGMGRGGRGRQFRWVVRLAPMLLLAGYVVYVGWAATRALPRTESTSTQLAAARTVPALPPLPRVEVSGEQVYLTLCTNVKALPAALVQAAAVRRAGSTRPFVVIVAEGLPQWGREALRLRGAQVVAAESLPYNFIGAPAYARGKWREAVVKLHMFRMTQFARVVFLDADVLVQRNVDHLFDLPLTAEAELHGMRDLHDCMPAAGNDFAKLNTGVLVFRPLQRHWDRLMANYENAPQRPLWMSDQDLIADTFARSTQLLPEAVATMFVQCACGRKLEEHSLVHGAGFLNTDALALYGTGNTGQGFMDCARPQYKLWTDVYLEECAALARASSDVFVHMQRVGFCNILSWPGKDAAWRRIKQLDTAT